MYVYVCHMHTHTYACVCRWMRARVYTGMSAVFLFSPLSPSSQSLYPEFVCPSIYLSFFLSLDLYLSSLSFMRTMHNALVIYHPFPSKKKIIRTVRISDHAFESPHLAYCGLLWAKILNHHKQSTYHWRISR